MSKTVRTLASGVDRSTDEYRSGRMAFREGLQLDDCPFPKSPATGQRMNWMSGYLDAQSLIRHGELFRRFGVQFP